MAYVVGSASVEIVPDFRNAQRKLTAFFEAQQNNIKVPVEFDVDQASAAKARAASQVLAQSMTEDQKKAHAAALRNAEKAAYDEAKIRERIFQNEVKLRDQAARTALRNAEKAAYDEAAARQRAVENGLRDEAKAQTKAEQDSLREQVKAQQDAAREMDRIHSEALKDDEYRERNADEFRARQIADREQMYERMFDRLGAQERQADLRTRAITRQQLLIEEDALSQTEKARVGALRRQEDAERESGQRIVNERLRQQQEYSARLSQQQKANGDSASDSAPVVGGSTRRVGAIGDEGDTKKRASLLGTLFGETLIDNAKRELRSRAAFIGAVLAGILIAGAPALLGAAVVLFGGLGLASTAASTEVREAWRNTWRDIVQQARESSSAFVDVHTDLAAQTSQTFRDLGPIIEQGMNAAAPQVEVLGEALLEFTQILTTGLSAALQQTGPAIRGWGDAFVSIGNGLSEAFAIMADNSVGAGGAVASLGQILGELLPTLGTLLSVGATVASNTLPLLSGALFLVNEGLQLIAPVLPLILTYFAALKVAALAAGALTLLSSSFTGLANASHAAANGMGQIGGTAANSVTRGADRVASGMTRASKAVAGAGAALPLLGVAIALVASEMQDASAQEEAWTAGILEGGNAYATAAQQATKEREKYGDGWVGQLSYDADAFFGLASSMDDATKAADEQLAAMSPLQRAQQLSTQAANDLSYAVDTYGRNSDEARDATDASAEAQANLAREQREANEIIKDTIPSADAAATAMEDYARALQAGDTEGAASSMLRYRVETEEAAEEQRLLNIQLGSTIPSADAASAAQDDLAAALRNSDPVAAAEALARYKRETDETRGEQSDLEIQIYGTTTALQDQSDQIRASTDSGFALRQANIDLTEAQANLTETMNDSESSVADMDQAQLDLETQIDATASAAGDLAADSLPATATSLERSKAANDAYLERLILLRDQMGSAFPQSLQNTITGLQNANTNMGTAEGGADLLTSAIDRIPAYHATTITADTSSAEVRIQTFLSRKWTADIVVTADMRSKGGYYADRAYGGPLPGVSPTDRADNILFNGTAGEFVTQRPSVRKYGLPFMYAVNNGLIPVETAHALAAQPTSLDLESAANGSRQSFADGGLMLPPSVVQYNANLGDLESRTQTFLNQQAKKAADAGGGPAGTGSLSGTWTSIYNTVKAAIPAARKNSTYRPGDPGYHGRNKAVDFGYGSGPGGAGSAGLASIARFLYNGFGSKLAELIYTGIGDNTPDIKNGRSHTYNAATNRAHTNHVHAAVYDWGGALHPGVNVLMNNTGATEYLSNSTAAINGFRDMMGKSSGSPAMPRFDTARLGEAGSNQAMGASNSVVGMANYGTIQTMDVEGMARQAEQSKRSSMLALGL